MVSTFAHCKYSCSHSIVLNSHNHMHDLVTQSVCMCASLIYMKNESSSSSLLGGSKNKKGKKSAASDIWRTVKKFNTFLRKNVHSADKKCMDTILSVFEMEMRLLLFLAEQIWVERMEPTQQPNRGCSHKFSLRRSFSHYSVTVSHFARSTNSLLILV